MPRILFVTALSPRPRDLVMSLAPEGFTFDYRPATTPPAELVEAARRADFVLLFRAVLPDDAIRAGAGRVKLIQIMSAGFDNMNLALTNELGIPVANNGGANAVSVSEHTLMLMLGLLRRLGPTLEATRRGGWRKEAGYTDENSFELAGKTVGIVGIGNIGRHVARRLLAFDAVVQYSDVFPLTEEQDRQLGVTRCGLDDLLRTSDIVTLHMPLTKDTRHLINAERLATMKPNVLIVNTSRGEIVDQRALYEALAAGRIGGAGLDVTEPEPIDPADPILALPNVIVTPHTAGGTFDTWARRARDSFSNMQRVTKGEPPLWVAR